MALIEHVLTSREMQIDDLVVIHVRLDFPTSFTSIAWWLRNNIVGEYVADHELAASLTRLLRHGIVALYDDGMSFVVVAR